LSGFIRVAKAMADEGSFEGFEGSISFAELNGFFREHLKKHIPVQISGLTNFSTLKTLGATHS